MSSRFLNSIMHSGQITFLFILVLVVISSICFAQNDPKVDSLLQALNNGIQDSCQVKTLCKLSGRMLKIGEPSLALKYANDAISLGEALKFKKGIADAKISKGNLYVSQSNYSEALDNYADALQLHETLGNQYGLALCYENIGYVYLNQGNYIHALNNFNTALKTCEAAGDKVGMASSSSLIGYIYQIQNNFSDALKYYSNALQISEEIGAKREMANANMSLGILQGSKGNYPAAINYLMNALKINQETGDSSEIASIHFQLGEIHRFQGNYSLALGYYLKTYKFYLKSGKKRNLAAVHGSLGYIYNVQGNSPEGLKHYIAAIKIFEEIGDNVNMAFTYNLIGNFHFEQSHYSDAQENFKIALHIYEEINNKNGIASTYNLLGMVDKKQGKYPEALDKYTQALKIYEGLENKVRIAEVRNNIGTVYSAQGQYNDALKHYKTSLAIGQVIGNKELMATCYGNMGIIQIRFQNPAEARKLLDTSLSISLEMEYKNLIKDRYKDLSTVDSMLGNFDLALEHYKLYTLYKDSLLNENNSKLITEMQTKYDAEKKDKEILKLESEKVISDLEIKVHLESLNRINLEKEKIHTENLFNLSQVDLLANEKKLQQLEIEKKEIEFAMQKAETESKQDELVLLNKEGEIQKITIKKQALTRNYLLAILGLILLASCLVYNNYITRQKLKLHALRNKIASDLHDDVGSTLSSIYIFSEIAREQSKEVIPMLDTIGESSKKMLDAMGDIVWTINPENDNFEKILDRMRSFAYELLGAKKIEFEFDAGDELNQMKLPMDVRKNLYLIFKEATNNMVKYSNANKAYFSLKEENRNLTMLIRDNGLGFDIAKSGSGNGIKNMQKRAEEMGGHLRIESGLNEGTTIQLLVAV